MALVQPAVATKAPMGLPESALEAAWVKIESDEADSTSSEWETSPCPSPRPAVHTDQPASDCPPFTTATPSAVAMDTKAGTSGSPTAAKTDSDCIDGNMASHLCCDLEADYYAADVDSVVELSKDRTYKVVLKTQTTTCKPLAMFVGDSEGKALAQAFRGWKWQNQGCRRPLTYDFLASVVEALGRKVMFVRICASERGVFYARAHFHPAPGSLPDQATIDGVDSRPSDALNVALRCGARVFVHRQLIPESI